jgi:phenylalanyl-tRNA synthetase alpha chain
MKTIQEIKEAFKTQIKNAQTDQDLALLKAHFLGKKGLVTSLMQGMKDLNHEERKAMGQAVNELKNLFENDINAQKEALRINALNQKLAEEKIDITLPGYRFKPGTRHLLNQIIEEVEDLFVGLGYTVEEGPEIETDEYNFEKLNLPKDHPARDMQDSFYIDPNHLLRTHTSPVQVRTMLAYGGTKPVKIICPGVVYRRDDDDATHSHQFMQIEGLVVDESSSMSDLKGTLLELVKTLFGDDRNIRLRPSYFPFTEPSVEVDVSCYNCEGKGCNICKHTGYIEILGAGMVNDHVLSMSGYDPKKYQGFAFGIGVERLAMLKYGIEDIRHFYTNDLRFLKMFKGGL